MKYSRSTVVPGVLYSRGAWQWWLGGGGGWQWSNGDGGPHHSETAADRPG